MTPERSVARPWTAQEDEALIRAVDEHGDNDNWKRVAMCVPGRTNKACRKVSETSHPRSSCPHSRRVSDGCTRSLPT